MPKTLTPEQIQALQAVPLSGMPNKVRIALTLAQAKQSDVSDETGIPAYSLSKIVNGITTTSLDNAQKLAAYFGCAPNDLFPPQVAA